VFASVCPVICQIFPRVNSRTVVQLSQKQKFAEEDSGSIMCEDSIEIIKITNWARNAAHKMDKAAKLLFGWPKKIELVNDDECR